MHADAALAADAYTVSMPATAVPAAVSEAKPQIRQEGIRCGRGILLMIGVEAVAALGIYGIWQAVHLIR